jgi:hypothetical protein
VFRDQAVRDALRAGFVRAIRHYEQYIVGAVHELCFRLREPR